MIHSRVCFCRPLWKSLKALDSGFGGTPVEPFSLRTMLDQKPFFTVGIPTFNRGDSLRSAIKQLLQQSFSDFELIISDNASQDNTGSVVEAFKDDRIKYIRHQNNIGALNNFRSIADQALGRYLVIHQDDDFLHRDFLSRCYEVVAHRSDIVLYATAWWRGNPAAGFKSKLLPDFVHSSFEFALQDRVLFVDGRDAAVSLMHPFYFAHPTIAIDSATLKKTGGYFADLDNVSDVITEARVLCEGTLAYDPRPGGIFTDHGSNYSRTMRKDFKVLTYQNMYRQLVDDFDRHSVPWAKILLRDLITYSDKELLALFGQWARYHAPKRLQDIGWQALRSRESFGSLKMIPRLFRKVGVRNLFRFLRRR